MLAKTGVVSVTRDSEASSDLSMNVCDVFVCEWSEFDVISLLSTLLFVVGFEVISLPSMFTI